MSYFVFIWDGENDAHIAEHGVTLEEAEFVVMNPDDIETNQRYNRTYAYGFSLTGKFLKVVVYEQFDELTVYVITAYEL
ncbi:DUF4258 domain-containing protein [uncultured Rubinisphaera sp.]|uniref:DUF4258 domain-containing protein n=1 Tax=uncultured Rubinisphaera sp. TaxID=1678686 RepID=UPI0030D70CDC|tara:strand:+ start:493 stop:729 length:237 start_codon:yes stop_codon:yes gene_type:complete